MLPTGHVSSAPHALACMCAQSCPIPCVPIDLAYQTPLSMGFSRLETGVGCHFLLQGILPDSGIEPHCKQILYLLSHWESLSLCTNPLNPESFIMKISPFSDEDTGAQDAQDHKISVWKRQAMKPDLQSCTFYSLQGPTNSHGNRRRETAESMQQRARVEIS